MTHSEFGLAVAQWYDAAPTVAPVATIPYARLSEELRFNVSNIRIPYQFTSADPYPTSKAMFADIASGRPLRVYTGGEPHPLLSQWDNNLFRLEHDYLGHYMTSAGFNFRGELIAAQQQSRHHSPLAELALLTETVGQTCWFNYSPNNIGRPNSERLYPPQKAILFPVALWHAFLELQS